MSISTWNVSYPTGQSGEWWNRAYLYAFSFVWWQSTIHQTALGMRLDGLGIALGYSIHINFKPNVWNWSSNRYTIDYLIQDGYATIPGGGLFPGLQSVTIEQGHDEWQGFPLLRMRDTGVPTPKEHICLFPAPTAPYWYQPCPARGPMPRVVPFPRFVP